jgi:hypothetical protein
MKACLVAFCLLLPAPAGAQSDDEWIPCTEAERKVAPDSALGSRDAVVLLYRLAIDDGNYGRTTRTAYYRVKIFTPEGMKLGDVSIPFIKGKTKVTDVAARMILPDGTIQEIAPDRIHEEEIFEADEVTIGRKAFSIPGIVVGSIIDYRFTVKTKSYHHTWTIGGKIPVLHAECDWKWYKYLYLHPNSAWLNVPEKIARKSTRVPDDESSRELLFTLDRLPVIRDEPHMMPLEVITPELICYYSGEETPSQYWKQQSQDYLRGFDFYLKSAGKAKEIADSLAPGKPVRERVKAAYEWVQSNFRNTSVHDTADVESDEDEETFAATLDELLERRSGSAVEIDFALAGILRAMDVTADLCLAVDNRYNRFRHALKYWQFDRTLVRALIPGGGAIHMAPDEPLAPFGMVPWYLEGTEIIVPGYSLETNFVLPPSPPSANTTTRTLTITTADSLDLLGRYAETITGQGAVGIKSALRTRKGIAREDFFREEIKESFPNGEIDSVRADLGSGTSSPVNLSCSVALPPIARDGNDRLLFHPFTALGTATNPFVDPRRDYSITMEYARIENDEVRLPVTPGWAVQEPIAEDLFGGQLGSGVVRGRVSGDTLIVTRAFTLKTGYWDIPYYKAGQDLFRRLEATKDFLVVLTRQKAKPRTGK